MAAYWDRPAFNLYCKIGSNAYLTVRDGKVVFASADAYNASQQWYIYKTNGALTFAVVNKATGDAMKHPTGDNQIVQLVTYSDNNDGSILWIEEKVNDGYTTIRKPNNANQVWDAQNGFITDGNPVQCYTKNQTNAQSWILAPCVPLPPVAPLVRISSKIDSSLFLTIKNGKVVIATSDESNGHQQWYKFDTEDGSSFAIVNKVTGQALKQPLPAKQVELVRYSSTKDSSILWSEHNINDADGYKSIRIGTNNSTQSLDVEKEVAKDDTPVICWEWNKQNNQRWIMQPCAPLPPIAPLVRAYCKAGPSWSLTVRDNNKAVLASLNPYDKTQQWYKVDASAKVKEENGYSCFALVNRATGQVIKDNAHEQPMKLIRSENVNDGSLVWNGQSLKDGYKSFRSVNNEKLFFDSKDGKVGDGVVLQCFTWNGGNGQRWNLAQCARSPVNNAPPVRVYSKEHPYMCITIKEDKVILAPSDIRADKSQLWYKVDASNQLNQDQSNAFFALVNEATGHAIKHTSSNQTVELVRHYSLSDKSTLWIEHSLADGTKSIRPVDDNKLTLVAAANSLALTSFSTTNASQRWIFTPNQPITKPLVSGAPPTFKVYTKFGSDYVITVRGENIVLALFNPYDNLQAWYKETRKKDENGFSYFVLVNKGTGHAVKFPTAVGKPLQLVEYKANDSDKSILWTDRSLDDEFVAIGLIDDYSGMTWDSQNTSGASDGVIVGCNIWHGKSNQRWKIAFH